MTNKRYEVPAQTRSTPCKGCGAWIAFVESETGKPMPVEAVGDARGEPHWIRCPKASEFKSKQGKLFQ